MNDLWLFLGFILFLFIIWVYSGGPNNPISFSGPYITPVTSPGSVQTGYGPSANTYFRSANTYNGSGIVSSDVIDSARSPFENDVQIGYSDVRTGNAREEYIVVRLQSDKDVDVTGWQLVSAKESTRVTIPKGSRSTSSTKRDIVLSVDYREAYLVSGSRASDSLTGSLDRTWHAFLGRSSDIWNDRSDTITLLDAKGKVVDQYSY